MPRLQPVKLVRLHCCWIVHDVLQVRDIYSASLRHLTCADHEERVLNLRPIAVERHLVAAIRTQRIDVWSCCGARAVKGAIQPRALQT
eukprot:5465021-Pleurochrysis_carterae.AAC.1